MDIKQRDIIVSHILSTIAFLKEKGIDFSDYIDFYQNKFEENGYYDVFSENAYQYVIETHLEGRRALYPNVEAIKESKYTLIRSTADKDFYDNPSFVFLGIENKEFKNFSKIMAKNNAKKLGIQVEIEYKNNTEYAYIYKDGI
ncbi:hypothetical protein O0I49_01475 [Staphylococcus pseudintermedius]|nr:hypothetical protein [Staphylococcus pseudintermedius]MDF0062293.1 hypothetical protein [Staphylococcus pseudintermedius]MDF0071935.1 hypothetical protein [Staphylococcus pseudintermedius]MDF0073679.1 hypothetical protein [Staphylococcus pseudintermedius]MDF0075856.1 hypothetical protein [Staphylococcus pseudintermedius]